MQLKVSIAGLTMDPASNTPIIILKAEDERTVPIWIGLLEATSIASAMQNINFDRPMTHDLFKHFCDMMGVVVTKVEVSDIIDNTFYARIHLTTEDFHTSMDARPSDAIAIALRFDAPIYVEESVMDQSVEGKNSGVALDDSEEGKKWADYLEKLTPEDFGKYKI